MKSDKELYQMFRACPELLVSLVSIDMSLGYTFRSETFKQVERSCDGLLECAHAHGPTYIFEFQIKKRWDIYPRLLMEMCCYHLEHRHKEVHGILVFLKSQDDPKTQPWHDMVQPCENTFQVLYLTEIVAGLDDTHPLKATLGPLVYPPDLVQEKAQRWFKALDTNPELTENQHNRLIEVFFSWLLQKLGDLQMEALMESIVNMEALSKTRFFRDLAKQYEAKAEQEKARLRDAAERSRQTAERERQTAELERQTAARREAKLREAFEQLRQGRITQEAFEKILLEKP